MREKKGEEARESLELCSVCNENPALPSKDMCLFCLKEMERAKEALSPSEASDHTLALDGVTDMEEIVIDMDDDDIPDQEVSEEIDRELSLDDVLAEEELQDDQEDEDANA